MLIAILLQYYQIINNGNYDKNILTDYIVSESLLANVDPQIILQTAKAESKLNPKAVGDHNTSFGLYQIHLPAHKGITKEQAEDPIWSTQWAINEMRKNGCTIWSTCKDVTEIISARDS